MRMSSNSSPSVTAESIRVTTIMNDASAVNFFLLQIQGSCEGSSRVPAWVLKRKSQLLAALLSDHDSIALMERVAARKML